MTIMFRRVLVAVLAALALSTMGAEASYAADDDETDPTVVLAELGYLNGVNVTFTIDEGSREPGLLQIGAVDRNAPLVEDVDELGYLNAYLAITPRSVPVPELVVQTHPSSVPLPAELAFRTVTADPVRISGLRAPGATVASGVNCWSKYYDWVQWYDAAGNPNPMSVHHTDWTYSTFYYGGKKRFSDSFIANCGNANVRHRIYYYNGSTYKKHWDSVVIPWHWEAVHKGSVHRHRKVVVNSGWGYTRSGRFHN
jgi:hypothetical protein